ncbi:MULTISPECIES: zinc-dependent alcohol dehydrogenase [unclassified Microbacterium]|uniref:zinc-dependent alcohol dehydrogenase n=1 Tax=unclassified Microbacterium TaxID=2609290 RepID=UPI00301A48AB
MIPSLAPSRPATMRAAVLHGRQDLRLEDVQVPRARAGELLLEVGVVGVCGTDATEWAYGPRLFPVESAHPVTGHIGPMVMGHEFSGTVVEVGEGVDSTWLGKLVASCGSAPCGTCRECVTGRSNLCRRYAAVGLHRDGALTRYVSTPVGSCVDVGPLGLTEEEAALAQPMAIAVHSLRRAHVEPGTVAIVQGIGGIGAFLIHALVDAGAHVVAVDLTQERLDVAADLGAQVTVRAGEPGSGDRIAAEFAHSIPVFFEVTGSDPGIQLAIDIVPMGTEIVLVGIQKALRSVDLARVTVRELSLIGTNAMVRETDFPEAARLVATRRGRWGSIAPDPLTLDRLVDEALRPMSDGAPPAIKTLVRPSR